MLKLEDFKAAKKRVDDTNLSSHMILHPTRADFLQNHGESASFQCWENERKHLILLTFFNVTLL